MRLDLIETRFLHQMEKEPHLRVPIRELESLPVGKKIVVAGSKDGPSISVHLVEDITTTDPGQDVGPRGAFCIVEWKGLNPQDKRDRTSTVVVTLTNPKEEDTDGAVVVRLWTAPANYDRLAWSILDLMRVALELA